MAERCFANTLRDYDCEDDNQKKSRSDGGGPEPDHVLLKAAISLKDEVIQATWVQQGRRVSDPTLYTGALGTAFLCFKAYHTTGSKSDLALCCEIVDSCAAAAQRMRKNVTFLVGQPGVYALGAAAANCSGDQRSLDRYLGLFYEASKYKGLAAAGEDGLPYELLYGRAGFLWAALFLRKHVGQEAVPATITDPIVDAILAGGRAGASASPSRSPLMYEWHGIKYWGAAHGLAGIMHTLMHFPLRAQEDVEDVKGTLRYMIRGRFPGGNYPSSDGKGSDRLVHWCHGAPGIAMTLCKAAEVFPADAAEFRQAAVEAGDVVWQRGLLRKLGLCHGISGNAYVFLALHRAMGGEEEEKKQQHLFRARQFASFLCKHGRALVESGEIHGGDRPYSLLEGLAGTACLFFDVTKPETTRFPAYEL